MTLSMLTARLTRNLAHADKMGKVLPFVTNPVALNTSQQQVFEWKKLHSILHQSITNIINNFHDDKEVQSIINLSPNEMNIIDECNRYNNYHIGSFRPDLLIARDTQQTKICEINARFTANGFLMTPLLSDGITTTYTNTSFTHYKYPNPKQFFDEHLDFSKDVFIIKGREYGNDIYLLKSIHPETVHIIHIDDVSFDDSRNTLIHNKTRMEIEQVVLELHQDEILSLSQAIINKFCAMSANKKLLNDFRTIFIVHTKQFLNLLSNTKLMQRYLDINDIHFLNKFLIKSFSKTDVENQDIFRDVIEDRNSYILKPVLLGKGEGIIFGDECTQNEWIQYIQTHVMDENQYVIQEYIDQEVFEFKSVLNDEYVQQNIVATLLCYNDVFYGPGINRSAPSRLIAVSRGGEILLPQIVDNASLNEKNFNI